MTNTSDNRTDSYNLQRFLDAQESTFEQARSELESGQKHSHWMWFIFPQIRGLGASPMSQRFALSDLQEAIAYLEHPVLGSRLRECTSLANAAASRSVSDVFGHPDDLKFHSSMTLFAAAASGFGAENQVFAQALVRYFKGQADKATLSILGER